ncbi:hypothetical protein D9V86_09400 [Bacteroidetes/Chlorobi group bacterium ChocPot_Mid]|nr:MAG: hypothetical protein D9V86_09400 [Bacteroidetes/Chlorobi group bacterium ChocPot_Mid]
MITKIYIENFKGIGSPGVEIELKPITLLFGANSSGKSTIFHALLYLNTILEQKSGDVYCPSNSGNNLNFNGFKNVINNHQSENL